jgi:hypothetical protein
MYLSARKIARDRVVADALDPPRNRVIMKLHSDTKIDGLDRQRATT